jgi:hypothetical protein
VLDATIFGNTLHVLADATTDDDHLREALGGDDLELRAARPSLEDVFVRLTRRADSTSGDNARSVT